MASRDICNRRVSPVQLNFLKDVGVTQWWSVVHVVPVGPDRYAGAMSVPNCRDTDYIDFLIASPRAFTRTEAASVQPEASDPPAHDAFTRLLHRLEPDPEALWTEAGPLVAKAGGVLVLDDSTPDKPYAKLVFDTNFLNHFGS